MTSDHNLEAETTFRSKSRIAREFGRGGMGPMMRRTHVASLLLGIVATIGAHVALAEPTEAEKRTQAEAIFAQAKDFMARKDFAGACPKLEAVVKLQPNGVGAKMSLGDCYIGAGKLASARAMYAEAASLAAQANQPDRASSAQDKAQSLDPRLSKLTIVVPPAIGATAGLAVTRDGSDLSQALFGVAVPTDGGHHMIRATAPHMKAFESAVDVAIEGGSMSVTVTLTPEEGVVSLPPAPSGPTVAPSGPSQGLSVPPPSPAPDTPGPEAGSSFWSPVRVGGIVVGGIGLVGVAAGIGIGATGAAKTGAAADAFTAAKAKGDIAGENAALDDHAAAHNQAVGGWVTTGIGGAALVAGVVMIAAAPRRATHSMSFFVAPWADASSRGIVAAGSF